MRMKDNFDSKERLLLEDKAKAAEAHKYAPLSTKQSTIYNAYLCPLYTIHMYVHYTQYISMSTIHNTYVLW